MTDQAAHETPPVVELPDELVDLSERGAALADSIRLEKTELDAIKSKIRELHGPGAYGRNGDALFTVGEPGRVWSDEQARTVLGPQWVALLEYTALNRALAEKVLPPDLYRACQVPTRKPAVSFKSGEED